MIFALIPRLRNCNVARVHAKGSGVERWRGVCSGEWGLRLLRIEESARARTETTKPAAKRKLLLQLLLSSPLMRLTLHVESFCGAIAAALLLQLRKQQALRHRGTAALLLRSWLLARIDWWLVCTGAVY